MVKIWHVDGFAGGLEGQRYRSPVVVYHSLFPIYHLLFTIYHLPEGCMEKRYKWRRADYQEKTRGLLIVNTGHGKGKTTCALGLMMRAAGRGLKCCMIQFMKSRNDRYGEHEGAEKLGIEVHTMGDGFTWDTKNPEQDRQTARETWNLCVDKLRSGDYDMLVFDELVYVLSYDLLPLAEVLEEIQSVRTSQPALHIVVTG